MMFHLDNRQKLKEGMSLGYLSIVAFHAEKVPINVFSSTLICCLTVDYTAIYFIKSSHPFSRQNYLLSINKVGKDEQIVNLFNLVIVELRSKHAVCKFGIS